MALRYIDFRCRACHETFELMIDTEKESTSTAGCGCGGTAIRFWKTAPGMMGNENVDREQMKAARSGFVRGADGRYIPPFRGTTRNELRAWEREHKVTCVSSAEINSRGVTIIAKTPFMESDEWKRKRERHFAHAREIAQSPDAVERWMHNDLEQPNDFDKNAFSQQAAAGVVAEAAGEKLNGATQLVAEEIAAK